MAKKIILSLFFFSIVAAPLFAEDIQALKAQIQALQERVQELEKSQQNIHPKSAPTPFRHPGFSNRPAWDPFSEMERIQEEMNRMFEGFHSGPGFSLQQNINVNEVQLREEKDRYVIELDTNGLNQEKLDVQINAHSITVQGEYSSRKEEENPHGSFYSSSFGSFMKTIPLPVDADVDHMSSEKKNDQLIIVLPKRNS